MTLRKKTQLFFFSIPKKKEKITLYHPKFWISIQVNKKLNVRVQSVTKVIIYGAKRIFKKFRMQSVIYDTV